MPQSKFEDTTPTGFAERVRQLESQEASATQWLNEIAGRALSKLGEALLKRGAITPAEQVQFVPRALVWARQYLIDLRRRGQGPTSRGAELDQAVQQLVALAVGRHFGQPRPTSWDRNWQSQRREGSKKLASGHQAQWLDWPARDVSGDFLVDGELDGDRAWFVLGDVCGKGWLAYCLAEAIRLLMLEIAPAKHSDPEGLLQTLSDELEPILPPGLFVAAAAIVLSGNGKARVAAAAVPPFIFRGKKWADVEFYPLAGTPLGLKWLESSEPPFDGREFHIDARCELLLMSDGVTDQDAAAGKALSCLTDIDADGRQPETMFERLCGTLTEALSERPQIDDITLLSLRGCKLSCKQCLEQDCAELATDLACGVPTATAELVERFRHRFTNSVVRILENPHDVEDAFQEAFAQFFQKLSQWNQQCPLCLWFRVIVFHQAIDILRQRRRRREQAIENVDLVDRNAVEASLATLRVEVADCLKQKIERAPERWKLILRERFAEQSTTQIGGKLGITRQAVGAQLRKINAYLAECWDQ